MNLLLSYPWWFVLFCLLLGLGYAYLLYFWRNTTVEKTDKKYNFLLAFLRFIAVSLISFLLLSPLIKTKNSEIDKPILIFAKDNTMSVGIKLSKEEKKAFEQDWNELISKLSKKYTIKKYNFSDHLNDIETNNFSGKETDISTSLNEIIERHANQNIGGVVLATDGIFNKGISPLYTESAKNFPIFSVALGDTTVQKDLFLNGLAYSEVVYLGDQFNLNINVRGNYLQNNTTLLQVTDQDGRLVYNTSININSNDFIWTGNVVLNANKSGVLRFDIKLKTVSGETILSNNNSAAYVEVLDARQKILMLFDAPHPDVKALRYVIEQNKNYQFEAKLIQEFSGSLSDYGLIILHGLPSKTNKIQSVLAEANNLKKSVLFILSGNTDVNAFNLAQKSLTISTSGKSGNDALARFKPNFSKFIIAPETVAQIEQFPPLLVPFGQYKMSASAEIAFTQKLGNVMTENPILLLDQNLNQRLGIIAGEGIWRWRMENYDQKENTVAFDDLFGKIIQFLSVKGDNRKFKLKVNKRIFSENESIRLDAELFNESFQLINNAAVSLSVSSNNGYKGKYLMEKVFNAYSLDVGQLADGDYKAIAITNSNGKSLQSEVRFSVKPIDIETMRLQADHGMLANLAKISGGKMVLPKQINSLENEILNNKSIKPIVYDFYKTKSLIDLKWLFFIAIFCLGIEWFIRKYRGGF